MVHKKSTIFTTMVDYKQRLNQAMGETTSVRQVASALGVSYQAVKKVVDGKSAAFTAENNAKVSKFLRVSPDWLATGLGEMRPPTISSAPPQPTAAEELSAITAALRTLDAAGREQAAVLLQSMARNPDGPWAGWLTQLISQPQIKSRISDNTDVLRGEISKPVSKRLQSDSADQIKAYNLGIFDGSKSKTPSHVVSKQPKRASK